MTTPMTTLQTRTRLSYLDNLRVVLTALVVLHHAAVTYSHIPLWYYYEAPHDDSATALDVFLALNQAYFMGFFFLIAGYFTPGRSTARASAGSSRDRLVRLGIPLLLFVIVVRAVVGIPGWSVSGLPYAEYYVLSWDPGPTWFLEVLLVFSLVYALVRRFRPEPGPVAAHPLRGRWIVAFVVGLAVATDPVAAGGAERHVRAGAGPADGELPAAVRRDVHGRRAGLPARLVLGAHPARGPVGVGGRRGGGGPVRPVRLRAGRPAWGSPSSRPCSPPP